MNDFKKYLPEFLTNIRMCITVGLSFEQAINETVRISNDFVKKELELFLEDIREMTRAEALVKLYNRNPSPDLNYLVKNLIFCHVMGASLVEMIDFYLKERNSITFEVIDLDEYLEYIDSKFNTGHKNSEYSGPKHPLKELHLIVQDLYNTVIEEHYVNDLSRDPGQLETAIKQILDCNIKNGLYASEFLDQKEELISQTIDLCDPDGFVTKYFQDEEVTSFSIINNKQLLIERGSETEMIPIRRTQAQIYNIIERYVNSEGYRIDERSPVLTKKFIKGRTFTLAAAIPPATTSGVYLRIDRVHQFNEKLLSDKVNKEKFESKILAAFESKRPIIVTGKKRGTLIMGIEKMISEYFDDSLIASIGIGLKMNLQLENCLNLTIPLKSLEGYETVSIKELQKIAESVDPDYVVLDRFSPEIISEFRYDILVGKLGLCLPMKTETIQAAKKIFYSEFPYMEHLKPLFIGISKEGVIDFEG